MKVNFFQCLKDSRKHLIIYLPNIILVIKSLSPLPLILIVPLCIFILFDLILHSSDTLTPVLNRISIITRADFDGIPACELRENFIAKFSHICTESIPKQP
mgnify:CR=1 FL=1